MTELKQKLENILNDYQMDKDTNIIFVTSFPRSDMGKGTIVSYLLKNIENSNALKFDGVLNTVTNVLMDSLELDDFGLYRKVNINLKFDINNYIIGGNLVKEFIEEFGGVDDADLTFRPHLSKYFISEVSKKWQLMGRPKTLIIEVGGTMTDFEVDTFIPQSISYLKKNYNCKVILLTEVGYSNSHIKTKGIQMAIKEFGSRFILPDIVLYREPIEMGEVNFKNQRSNSDRISRKIQERTGLYFESEKIIPIPFYKDLSKLEGYVSERIVPIIL